MTLAIGVDPGSVTSALIVRDGRDCLAVELVERGEDWPSYFAAVLQAFADLYAEFRPELYAVEGCVAPNPHLGMTNVAPLIETAELVGAFRDRGAKVIRPAGFGRVPEDLAGAQLKAYMEAHYPARLLSPRETSYGGVMRHARSAWDCAAAAEQQSRQQALFGGAR